MKTLDKHQMNHVLGGGAPDLTTPSPGAPDLTDPIPEPVNGD